MPDSIRLARRFGAPLVVALALISVGGCASKKTMYADEDDYGEVSAREYGYVRPADDVWVLGEAASAGRAQRTARPAAGGDLWGRVRSGMKLNRYADARIDGKVQAFRRDPQYLAKLSQRARPYLQVVVDEIERRGLPAELALLPHVESRYNPAATSPKAAAGMWQFIPSTGRIMGLRQDSGYDGRRDVLASTKAAMDYLTQLQRRLGGSWELAMAAYNCGPGRVESAQAANLRAGRPTDFWSLDLPAETEAYVPQILAAARLVSEPAKYGLSLPPVPAGHQMELVKSDRPVDLVRVAQASGVQVSELQRLNPGIVNGYSASQVLVPAGAGGRVGSGLGRVQVVPATAAAATLSPVRAVARVPSALPTPAIDTSGPRPEPARRPAAEGRVHVVRSGESLASIARAQGLEVQDLAELNAMRSGEPLLPGQSLRLPGSGGRHSALAAELVTHRVQRGDSIAAIARRYGVTVADVKRWNPVAGNALRSGGLIRIYRKGGTAS